MIRSPRFRFTVRKGMAMVLGIALLLALLMPAINARLEDARQTRCRSNLFQLAFAVHNYHTVYDSFPPGTVFVADLPPEKRLGWLVPIWPLRTEMTRIKVDPGRSWDAPANWPPSITSTVPIPSGTTPEAVACDPLTCPNERTRGKAGPTNLSYVGISGLGPDAATLPKGHKRAGVFGYDRVIGFADIQDGLSNTMMFAETADAVGPFTAGGPSSIRPVDPAARPHVGRGRAFGGLHPGGAYIAMCDGSVKFFRVSQYPDATFEAISTINGGESIPHGRTEEEGALD